MVQAVLREFGDPELPEVKSESYIADPDEDEEWEEERRWMTR
jgi:hypothetical protein